MKDSISFGTTPVEEPCVSHGSMIEAIALIRQLKRMFGEELEIRAKSNPHNFGNYLSLEVYFDTDDPDPLAFKVEKEFPLYWDEEAKEYLKNHNYVIEKRIG